MCVYVCVSAWNNWNNSASTWWIFMKFDTWAFLPNVSKEFRFHQNLTSVTDTLHEDLYHIYFNISLNPYWIWEMLQTKPIEKIKTHISCSVTFFAQKLCHLWDNVAKKYGRANQATDDNMIRRMRFACWGYRHRLRICYTYCFSTIKVVTRTRLISCLVNVLCTSCFFFRRFASYIVRGFFTCEGWRLSEVKKVKVKQSRYRPGVAQRVPGS